jgi:hypothetical protein
LVFLDFDDVVCVNSPYGGYDVLAPDPPSDLHRRLFHAPAIEALKAIVDEFDPLFVITSSWLRMMDRDAFEGLFEKCDLQFIGRRLHNAWEAPQDSGMTRLQSIEQWLWRHHTGQAFVVLDDPLSGTGLAGSRLDATGRVVFCAVNEGLHAGHLPLVRRALAERVQSRSGRTDGGPFS